VGSLGEAKYQGRKPADLPPTVTALIRPLALRIVLNYWQEIFYILAEHTNTRVVQSVNHRLALDFGVLILTTVF